jgi:hypothetical protein
MLQFTAKLRFLNFDSVKFTRRLDRIMGQIIREAAREWLRAVLKSVPSRGGFPVWSGAAKMTLVPLGRFLNNVAGLSVSPVAGAPDRRSMGEESQQFEITDDRNNGGSFEYSFEWSTDLLHYYVNEFYGYIPSAPWNTQEAGRKAFEAYVDDAIERRLPEIDIGLEEI